ncbi:MAG: dipeptidase [Phycisphaerales bacterium]
MTSRYEPVREAIDAELDASVARLSDLLSIPSVSTDPAYNDDVARAAAWCRDQLADIGFDAQVHETTGHPMVVAVDGPEDAPTVLYYGHYDVQPPEPLELWDSPPFEPQVVDGPHGKRIVARGAVDDKGQLLTFIEAFRAWKKVHGELPVRVKVMLEGEEESGSPSLEPFLEANKQKLAADVCVVCDTGMWDINTPAVTYMLRGLVYLQVTLHGPSHDLHSGMYGGAVPNPNNVLARILGQLHDDEGRVQIPGFYDDVRELSDEEAAMWRGLGFDEAAFLGSAGIAADAGRGEAGRSVLERTWSRPTCDVNGMWGGYTGRGAKTVIPAESSAKISCRLVADQDAEKVRDGLMQFIRERTPAGCRVEFEQFGCEGAIRVPTESSWLDAARAGLEDEYGTPAALIGTGGSIPVVGSFQHILGFDSLLVGFGLDDDRMHSPNEKFELTCYHRGIRSHAAILARFEAMQGG